VQITAEWKRKQSPTWHKMGYFGDASFQTTNFTAANNQTHSFQVNTHRKLIQTQKNGHISEKNTRKIWINWCLPVMTYLLSVEICLHFAKFGMADATTAVYVVAHRHCHYLRLGVAVPATVHQQTLTFPVLYVRHLCDPTTTQTETWIFKGQHSQAYNLCSRLTEKQMAHQ